MDIALMNERVTFQENTVTVDEVGNHLNEWTDFHECACTVSGESGNETEDAGQTVSHPEMSLTVRWCRKASQITSDKHRVVFRDENYDITSIDHMAYKRKCLKFHCRKEERSG